MLEWNVGTYGIVRNVIPSVNLLARLVARLRDGKVSGIDTLDAIWNREDRHICSNLRVYSEGS